MVLSDKDNINVNKNVKSDFNLLLYITLILLTLITSFTIKKNEMKIDNMINNHESTWFLNSYTILIANNILNTLAILAAILTNKLFWKFCLPTLLIFFISFIFFLFFDYS